MPGMSPGSPDNFYLGWEKSTLSSNDGEVKSLLPDSTEGKGKMEQLPDSSHTCPSWVSEAHTHSHLWPPIGTSTATWSSVLPSWGPTNVFYLCFSARPSAMSVAGILGNRWIFSELYCPICHLLIS